MQSGFIRIAITVASTMNDTLETYFIINNFLAANFESNESQGF